MMPLIDAIDLVIFDLDDTLLDHSYALNAALLDWLPQLNDDRDDETLIKEWQRVEDATYPRYVRGELTLQEQRRERLKAFGPAFAKLPEDELDNQFADYLALYAKHWRENYGASTTVYQLLQDGKHVAVLTSGAHTQQAKKMRAIGISPDDVPLFGLEDVPVPKPDPKVFTFVCEHFGVEPDRALMVGDNRIADIDGAIEAGLHAAWYTNAGTGTPRNVAQICDLRDVLQDF